MNPSQQIDMSRGDQCGGFAVPRKEVGRVTVRPQSERTSGFTSPSNVQPLLPNYPSPRSPESMSDPPVGTTQNRGGAYTLFSWLPEILCCFLGFAALAVDIIILSLANGQPPTKLTRVVTVNSLIQFITSIAKLAFMVPIISAMGQLKWLWFENDARPLTDFLLHDGATSGGLGSIRFSLTLRILFRSPIAWLGAIVALSGFFTSPLTQQAIGYTSTRQALSNGTASILRASAFSRSSSAGFKPVDGDELLVQTAYLTAAYLGPNQTLPGVDPICSSGDCDWPTYGSLGICTEVVNISASSNTTLLSGLLEEFLIELRQSQYSVVFSEAGTASYYLTALLPLTEPSTEFKEAPSQTVISQAVIVHFHNPVSIANDTNLAQIQYIGVSQYFCAQSYRTTVKNGIHNTSELAFTNNILSSTTTVSVNSYWNSALYLVPVCDPGPETGATITLGSAGGIADETYTIDFCTAVYLSDLYIIGTSGGILLQPNGAIFATVGQISQALGIAVYGDLSSPTIPDPATQYANVKLMMQNIGRSLTTYMRNEGPTFLNQDNSTVVGVAYGPQTLIHVRWSYMAFLAIQLGLAIVVLLFTIFATYRSRIQILKGDSLATMCALSIGVKTSLGGIDDMKELKKRAKDTKVLLVKGSEREVLGLDALPTAASPRILN